MRRHLFFLLLLIIPLAARTEILIIVPIFNRPDLISLQQACLKKFLKDDYRVILFSDANTPEMQMKNAEEAKKADVECIQVPQNVHNIDPYCDRAPSSFRHGEVLQYAFDNYGLHHDDIVVFFDSDVFLIREFSIREYLGDHDLNAFGQMMFVHFSVMNMPKLEDKETLCFRAKMVDNGTKFIDAGEGTIPYIKAHEKLKIRQMDITWGLLDLNVDVKANIRKNQLLDKGYGANEIELIKSIYDGIARETAVNPRNKDAIFYDGTIGFHEVNVLLDYKHGTSYNPNFGPVKGHEMQRTKDLIVKDFLNKLLAN